MVKEKPFDLLIVGDLNVDLILSDPNPVPIFGQHDKLVQDTSLELGGSAAIVACGAARLGLRTAFVGKVGDDIFGQYLVDTLKARGVDIRAVQVDRDQKTGITVHLSRPDDRAMLTYRGTVATLASEEIPMQLLRRARHLHVSSYFLQTALLAGLPGLFRLARQSGLSISLDPGWDPAEAWNNGIQELLPLVGIFMPNQQEFRWISGLTDWAQAAEEIGATVPWVVVKRGPDGAALFHKGQIIQQAAFPVPVVDTTGAGDSFASGFLYGFLNGWPGEECLRWGCACGSLSAAHFGGIAGQPTAAEVEAFLPK